MVFNARGKAVSGDGTATLTLSGKQNPYKYVMTVKKAYLFGPMSDYFANSAIKQAVDVPVFETLDGVTDLTTLTLIYSATTDKNGQAKK